MLSLRFFVTCTPPAFFRFLVVLAEISKVMLIPILVITVKSGDTNNGDISSITIKIKVLPKLGPAGLGRRGWHWTPKGHCGCLVENLFQN